MGVEGVEEPLLGDGTDHGGQVLLHHEVDVVVPEILKGQVHPSGSEVIRRGRDSGLTIQLDAGTTERGAASLLGLQGPFEFSQRIRQFLILVNQRGVVRLVGNPDQPFSQSLGGLVQIPGERLLDAVDHHGALVAPRLPDQLHQILLACLGAGQTADPVEAPEPWEVVGRGARLETLEPRPEGQIMGLVQQFAEFTGRVVDCIDPVVITARFQLGHDPGVELAAHLAALGPEVRLEVVDGVDAAVDVLGSATKGKPDVPVAGHLHHRELKAVQQLHPGLDERLRLGRVERSRRKLDHVGRKANGTVVRHVKAS